MTSSTDYIRGYADGEAEAKSEVMKLERDVQYYQMLLNMTFDDGDRPPFGEVLCDWFSRHSVAISVGIGASAAAFVGCVGGWFFLSGVIGR